MSAHSAALCSLSAHRARLLSVTAAVVPGISSGSLSFQRPPGPFLVAQYPGTSFAASPFLSGQWGGSFFAPVAQPTLPSPANQPPSRRRRLRSWLLSSRAMQSLPLRLQRLQLPPRHVS